MALDYVITGQNENATDCVGAADAAEALNRALTMRTTGASVIIEDQRGNSYTIEEFVAYLERGLRESGQSSNAAMKP